MSEAPLPCRVWDDDHYLDEDTFYVTASERTDMRIYNQNVPYTRFTVSTLAAGPQPKSRVCLLLPSRHGAGI